MVLSFRGLITKPLSRSFSILNVTERKRHFVSVSTTSDRKANWTVVSTMLTTFNVSSAVSWPHVALIVWPDDSLRLLWLQGGRYCDVDWRFSWPASYAYERKHCMLISFSTMTLDLRIGSQLHAMQWLIKGAAPNDSLFFHCACAPIHASILFL